MAGAVPKGLAVGCPPSQLPSAPGCRAPRTVQGGPRARQTRGPHGTDAWGAGGWSTPPRRLAGVSCMDGARPRPAPGGGLTAPRNRPCLSRPPWVAWRPPAPSGGRGHSGQDAGVQLGSRSKHPRPPTFPGLQSRGLVRGPPGVWELLTTAPPRPRGLTLHPPGALLACPGTDRRPFPAQGDGSTRSHGVGCSAPFASRWGQAHWGDKGTEAPRRPHEAAVGAGWTPQGFTAQGRWLRAGSGPRPASTGGPCHALARATSTCPGALHPPCPSPPTSCLAPRWLSGPPSSSLVDARGPLPFSGRSLGSRYLQGPRGQKGASRRRPPLASGVGLGLGSRPRPGPPARGGGAAGSASGPEAAWPSAAQVYCTAP